MLLNLPQQNKSSKLSSLKYRLYMAIAEDVDVENFPKPVHSTIASNILLPGKKWKFVEAKPDTLKPNAVPGEKTGNMSLEVNFQLEGMSKNTLDWLKEINGERFYAVWVNCDTQQKFIGGSACSSLLASVQSLGIMDDGFNGATIQLKGGDCPDPINYFDGVIVLDDPQIVPANSATFALGADFQYQFSDNTANTVLTDITGVSDDEVGRFVELVGGGVQFPTQINPSEKFILKNGMDWSAALGSKITFQIVKTGTDTYAFYEIDRSN